MQSRYWLLLGIMAIFILVGCTGLPGTKQPTAVDTTCPPATTPERFMAEETETIRTRLTDAGLDQVSVGVTGFQNCPDIPTADKPGWIDITVTVAEVDDTAYLGDVIGAVQTATADWPKTIIHLNLHDTESNPIAGFNVTNQDIETLQTQGFSGTELYEKLLATQNP